ncbi:hypothetical protein COCNU_01G012290 [Cocos nucifera]|uniref:Uncharacterized protein n=1 Tax=Cocos nucifera TaxID=13894 RepID=A0A8K0MVC2_COCNU|nr:hypothetical protein COCNU_01G012290 [Cocos nucifera]
MGGEAGVAEMEAKNMVTDLEEEDGRRRRGDGLAPADLEEVVEERRGGGWEKKRRSWAIFGGQNPGQRPLPSPPLPLLPVSAIFLSVSLAPPQDLVSPPPFTLSADPKYHKHEGSAICGEGSGKPLLGEFIDLFL